MVNKDCRSSELTKIVVNACSEKFGQDLPNCHLDLILGKFIQTRLHFYGKFIDKKLQKMNKKAIKRSANASKSTKAAMLKYE